MTALIVRKLAQLLQEAIRVLQVGLTRGRTKLRRPERVPEQRAMFQLDQCNLRVLRRVQRDGRGHPATSSIWIRLLRCVVPLLDYLHKFPDDIAIRLLVPSVSLSAGLTGSGVINCVMGSKREAPITLMRQTSICSTGWLWVVTLCSPGYMVRPRGPRI